MATLRLFRTACACLTMCPFVMCGGDGRVLTRQHTGVHSAWVSPPASHSSFRGSGSGLGPTKTSRWGAAPRSSTSPTEGCSPSAAVTSAASQAAAAVVVSRERKRRSPAAPLLCTLRRGDDERYEPPPPLPPSPLFSRLGRAVPPYARGHGIGGFRLGAVTAVRSPGDGGGTTSTAVDEELKEAFDAAAGGAGLLGLAGFRALADVRELLEDGLLQDSEVLAIWKAVPKADAAGDRVDFAGFCEAFARVDSLFEEEEEQEERAGGSARVGEAVVVGSAAAVEAGGEAEASFLELVGSPGGVLDLAGLLRWDEVTELVEEGLLTQQEVEQMWEGLPKVANSVKAAGAPGTDQGMLINLQGFLEFDRKLSDLFEDEESDDVPAAAPQQSPSVESLPSTPAAAAVPVAVVEEEETAGAPLVDEGTPEGQFVKLSAGSGGVVTLDGLLGWTEVSELLEDDLITREEVSTMFQALPKAKGRGSSSSSPAIDVKGFVEFSRKLDEMFEEDDDEEDAATPNATAPEAPTTPAAASAPLPDMKTSSPDVKGSDAAEAKARLLSLSRAEMADCGMGCGENKRTEMLEAMEALLATEEGNLVLGEDLGTGLIDNLVGEWRLLYTSSNAMEYNQGLTGLANTIPKAKFQGLRQILHADGMVFDAEYEEELVTGDKSEPLIITVTSDWEVKQTSSLITGKSTVAVAVSPKQIKYGFITVRSERWKTLRAMMLLDIAYLDADLRIMRGQTARQNFFVFARV
eukprot:g8043.t1